MSIATTIVKNTPIFGKMFAVDKSTGLEEINAWPALMIMSSFVWLVVAGLLGLVMPATQTFDLSSDHFYTTLTLHGAALTFPVARRDGNVVYMAGSNGIVYQANVADGTAPAGGYSFYAGAAGTTIQGLAIDPAGIISGFFTNGQTSELAQIILASFPNPWALNKLGSNLFGETVMSGSSVRNIPGASGMGTLTPNTLEMSNTDIATEFIRMITAQKAYQANAKVITTGDMLMQVLMNIKQ